MDIRLSWNSVEGTLRGLIGNCDYYIYNCTGSTPVQLTAIQSWMRTNFDSNNQYMDYIRAKGRLNEDIDGTFDVDDTMMFSIVDVISNDNNGNPYTAYVFELAARADTKPARAIPPAN